jgi:hypothetical protein
MLKRRTFDQGVSLPLLIVYTLVLIIFYKQIFIGYMYLKRINAGIDGYYVISNYEFVLFYMIFLIFIDSIPIVVLNLIDYSSYKKRMRCNTFVQMVYLNNYFKKRWIIYPIIQIGLFVALITLLFSYTVFSDTDIKEKSFLFHKVIKSYSDIETIDCSTQWVSKATQPFINLSFKDNSSVEIGSPFIHDVGMISAIIEKSRPSVVKKASNEFIDTYLNEEEKKFYSRNFTIDN